MTKTIFWKNLIGQERTKETLGNAFTHETLGHAYLFCGDAGAGKFQAALELSMALLCLGEGNVPCYSCESCAKILRNAHQDFHVVAPVALEKEQRSSDGKLNQEGWRYLSTCMQEKISKPYAEELSSGTASIPLEWVKEINHAIVRGAVSAGMNIAVIDDVDIMNKESANAMLKTLEEPPPHTLLILLTTRPQSVLPTIISRCQILRLGAVPADQIQEALINRFGFDASPAVDEAVRLCMGAPGKALSMCENSMGNLAAQAARLLDLCIANDWQAIGAFIDELSAHGGSDAHEKLLMRLAHGVRNRFLSGLSVSATYIDTLDFAEVGKGGSFPSADVASVQRLLKACQDAISALRAYGNVSLVFVHFILTLTEIIHGK
jgi:DNA polymerase III delta' subunit